MKKVLAGLLVLVLGVSAAPSPNFVLAWRRCLPTGCFADVQVGPDLLKLLRSRSEPMQISKPRSSNVRRRLRMRRSLPAFSPTRPSRGRIATLVRICERTVHAACRDAASST